jgi:hypothetical protein
MAARRARTVGLTDQDVQRLRDQLADGRRPRVQLSGSQFAAAPSATVVRIGDPAVDGSDYLTVRVKVNGVLDELAFAPAELQLGGRRPAAQPIAAARPGRRKAAPRTRTTPPLSPAAASPTPAAASPIPAAASPTPVAEPVAASQSVSTPTLADRADSPAGRSTAARRRKPTSTPTVTFTVASSDDSWTVSANRGAKGILKHVPVQPGVVTALAELLAQPALLDAVAEINQTALSQAQARAEELRAELHRLEAVLATHRTPGS